MRWPLAVVAALLVSVTSVSTGCAGDDGTVDVTESQAYDRVEAYVRRAAAALPPARLELDRAAASAPCKDDSRVRVTNSYWLRDVSSDSRHFDTLLTWWTGHGFDVLDDLRPERRYVWVENTEDGFRMSLRDNPHGELLLAAESPCVPPE